MAEEIYPMPSFPTLIVKAGNVREVTVTDPD
jgi:hypothetical protein